MPYIKIAKCLTCDVPHSWLFEGPTLKELRQIKAMTGMTAKDFGVAAGDGDPDANAALLVILHKRDKINVSIDDVDLDFADFEVEPTETEKEEIAKMEADGQADGGDPKP